MRKFFLLNVNNEELRDFLYENSACHEAQDWLGERNLRVALAECPNPTWINWYIVHLNPSWVKEYEILVVPLREDWWDQAGFAAHDLKYANQLRSLLGVTDG